LDNYATHKTPAIRRWLTKRPRYHLHFTPIGASWINLVERWFALLTQKQLRRAVHPSTRALETAILEYIAFSNIHPKPFVRTTTSPPTMTMATPAVLARCTMASTTAVWGSRYG